MTLGSARRIRRILLAGIFCLVMGYFFYHLFEGRYGLKAWRQLKEEHKELQYKAEVMQEETSLLQDKVDRLHPANLDMDYVEELIHEKAGIYHKDDLIVHPHQQPKN